MKCCQNESEKVVDHVLLKEAMKHLEQKEQQMIYYRYFEGKKPQISELPLAPIGGEFRQTVWKMLTEIPYGKVITYGELAQKIAKQRGIERMSAQAVGGAVGHNPISIIIPCHRVVGANGNLTGFSGGIEMKLQLLQHEGVDINRFYIPTKGTAL